MEVSNEVWEQAVHLVYNAAICETINHELVSYCLTVYSELNDVEFVQESRSLSARTDVSYSRLNSSGDDVFTDSSSQSVASESSVDSHTADTITNSRLTDDESTYYERVIYTDPFTKNDCDIFTDISSQSVASESSEDSHTADTITNSRLTDDNSTNERAINTDPFTKNDLTKSLPLRCTEEWIARIQKANSLRYQTKVSRYKDGDVSPTKQRNTSGSYCEEHYIRTNGHHQPMPPYDSTAYWDTESTLSDISSFVPDEPFYHQLMVEDNVREQPWPSLVVEESDTRVEDSFQDFLAASGTNPTQWCQVRRVLDAGTLERMTEEEKDLHETKYEILTTEASCYKQLVTLRKHFIQSAEFRDPSILPKQEYEALAAFIRPVEQFSKCFLRDLVKCWHQSIYLTGIFELIREHWDSRSKIYITYCSNLKGVEESFKILKLANKKFDETLKALERSENCSKLPLTSFLSLPMKRITGLDLLLKRSRSTLLKIYNCGENQDYQLETEQCLLALDSVQHICTRSDKESQKNNRMKTMMELSQKLKYPANVQQLALLSPDRWLIMHGEVRLHGSCVLEKTSERKKTTKNSFKKANATLRVFLFNDLLLLTKKKSKSQDGYKVMDYCSRDNLVVITPKQFQSLKPDLLSDLEKQYFILLEMNENHEKKRLEMILSCLLKEERDLWLAKLRQKPTMNDVSSATGKQMTCVYPFGAGEPGHLCLREGDEVKVIRILENGWMEGLRMRGNKEGIFPPSRVDTKK